MDKKLAPSKEYPYVLVACGSSTCHLALSVKDILGGYGTPRKSLCGKFVDHLYEKGVFNPKDDCQTCRRIQEERA
jgi:hypothetical protein